MKVHRSRLLGNGPKPYETDLLYLARLARR